MIELVFKNVTKPPMNTNASNMKTLIEGFTERCKASQQDSLRQAPSIGQATRQFPILKQFQSLLATISKYESMEAQEEALSVIDLERVYSGATTRNESNNDKGYDYTDFLVIELLHWFKEDFFKWVNEPEAPEEYGKPAIHTERSNNEEMIHGASRTEVYTYSNGHCIRFPRYNDPVKLLHTRQGRCGEFANVFCLILRAMGLRTRYVWNFEDHVWCEVWSVSQGRWCHVDSCEAAFDEPMLYAKGWGKKMSYVFAVSVDGVQDVSRRYIDNERTLARDKVPDGVLAKFVKLFNAYARRMKDDGELMCLFIEDHFEQLELQGESKTSGKVLLPRQTGSASWTNSRGENGL